MAAYSDIKKGAEFKKGLDNYIKWLSDLDERETVRVKGQGQIGTKGASKRIAVVPFGYDMPGTVTGVVVKTPERSITELQTELAGRYVLNYDPESTIDLGPLFVPAKVIFFKTTAGQRARVQSKTTKLYYIKYPGTTFSHAFGAAGSTTSDKETEEYATAISEVRAAILSVNNANYNRVSFKEENYRAL